MKALLMTMLLTVTVSLLLIAGLFQLQSTVEELSETIAAPPVQTECRVEQTLPHQPGAVGRYRVKMSSVKDFSGVADAMNLRLKLLGAETGSVEVVSGCDGAPELILNCPADKLSLMKIVGNFELRARKQDGETGEVLKLNAGLPGVERLPDSARLLVSFPGSQEELIGFFQQCTGCSVLLFLDGQEIGRVRYDQASKQALLNNQVLLELASDNSGAAAAIAALLLSRYPTGVDFAAVTP